MADPKPLADLFGVVLRKGDPVRAHRRLRLRNGGMWHFLRAQALAAVFTAGTGYSDQVLPIELTDLASYPAVAVPAAGLALLTYLGSRVWEKVAVNSREKVQHAIRDRMGDVDIVRISPALLTPRSITKRLSLGRRRYTLAVRWYGVQKSSDDVSMVDAAVDLARVLKGTKDTAVETFILDASGLSKFVDVTAEELGKLLPSNAYSGTRRIEIGDRRAGEQVLVANREQCVNVLRGLMIGKLTDLIKARDSGSTLPALAARIDPVSGEGLKGFAAAVEQEIAMDAPKSGKRKIHTTEGTEIYNLRVTSSVVGNVLQSTETFVDEEHGVLVTESGPTSQLPGGMDSWQLDELLTNIARTNGAGASVDALKAVLLQATRRMVASAAAGRSPLEVESGSGSARVVTLPPERAPTTMFERLATIPPRSFMRRSGGKGSDLDVRRRKRKGPRVLRAAKALATSLALTAGVYVGGDAVGIGSNWLADTAIDSYAKEHSAAHSNESLSDYVRREHPLAFRYAEAKEWLGDVRTNLDRFALETVGGLGVPDDVVAAVEEWVTGESRGPIFSGAYANRDGSVSVGDVQITSKAPVFKIKSVGGESTAGYWFTAVNDLIQVEPGAATYPFNNVGLTFTSAGYTPTAITGEGTTEVPTAPPPGIPIAFEVDIPLTRSQLATSRGFPLVAKSGFRVVAAEFRSGDNSADNRVQVVMDEKSGTYFAHITGGSITPDNPVLRYWLTPDSSSVIRAKGPMLINTDSSKPNVWLDPENRLPLSAAMAEGNYRQRILEALGLPDDASESQILSAIRSKHYSFTPQADSPNLEPYRNSQTTNAAENLSDVAAAMARWDDENCNGATTIEISATGGKVDGKDVNAGVGFNNVNGDDVLTPEESHVVPVDTAGKVIEPTPGFADGGRPSSADTGGWEWKLAGGLLGGGSVVLTVLVRRRRQLRSFVAKVANHAVERLDRPYGFIEGNDDTRVAAYHYALDIANHVRYAPEGTKLPLAGLDGRGGASRTILYQRDLIDRLASEAANARPGYRQLAAALAEADLVPSPETEQALRTLASRPGARGGKLSKQPRIVRAAVRKDDKREAGRREQNPKL